MAFHLGTMLPEQNLENSAFQQALIKVAANLHRQRPKKLQTGTPVIDLVFLLPGAQEKPDFEGMRLNHYSSAHRMLRIESAVPGHLVESAHAERFILAALQDAVDAAADFFMEQNILFNRDEHLMTIERLSDEGRTAVLH